MTLDLPTALIAAIFASQIVVCSFISAWRFKQANQSMLRNYPPRDFPKLYPITAEKMQQQHTQRMALRMGVAGLAILVLIVSLAQQATAYQLAERLLWVAMAQMLPMLLFLPQQLGIARALKAMPPPAVRSAELRAWRVTDFVSPTAIALALAASTAPLCVATYFWLQGTPSGNNRLWVMALFCGLLLARMLYVLLVPATMKRPDPYISDADLFRARQARMRLLFSMGIFMGIYITFMQLVTAGLLQIDRVFVIAGVSVLVQLLSLRMSGMLRNIIEKRDFTPYRAEPTAGAS
jgi:hypothetical protein